MANKLMRNLQALPQDSHDLLQDWLTVPTSTSAESTKSPTKPTSTLAEPFSSPVDPTSTPAGQTSTFMEPISSPAEPTSTHAEPISSLTEQTSTHAEPTRTLVNQYIFLQCHLISQIWKDVHWSYSLLHKVPSSLSAKFTLNMFLQDITCPPTGPILIMHML